MGSLEYTGVSRDPVPHSQHEDVARHDLPRVDLDRAARSNNVGARGPEALQLLQGRVRPRLLDVSERRVQDDDCEDRQRIDPCTDQESAGESRYEQQPNEDVGELPRQPPDTDPLLRLERHVGPDFREPPGSP